MLLYVLDYILYMYITIYNTLMLRTCVVYIACESNDQPREHPPSSKVFIQRAKRVSRDRESDL